MENYTLVDRRRLRNPRSLLYFYPSIPAVKYKKIADKYHENIALDLAERIARIFGCILVPASCIHHTRKDSARRIMIYGHAYYVKHPDELTDTEMRRYRDIARRCDFGQEPGTFD